MKTMIAGKSVLPGCFPEDSNLLQYAKNLGLAGIWRQRQTNAGKGSFLRASAMDCITNCTECVTSCTECVASPGGGCGLTSLVSSPCVPKPDIGEQDF